MTPIYDGYTESEEQTAARKARILKAAKKAEKLCICLEYIGDNGPCPVHGPFDEPEGSDNTMGGQLDAAGFGPGGVL